MEREKQMKHDSSTISWNGLGDELVELAQTGESRNCFIMPTMFHLLKNVEGKKMLDLGCGEGGYARELARKGAEVVAIDCSEKVIQYAVKQAERESFDIADSSFDIVLCSMMLMDCEDFEGTVKEIVRVLKPEGRLFASVLHPCFNGNHEKGIDRQGSGPDRQVVVKNYFEPSQWEAPLNRGTIPVIWRHRTLEDYVKTFIKCGLTIVDMNEPRPTQEQADASLTMAFLRRVPLYLYWELKK